MVLFIQICTGAKKTANTKGGLIGTSNVFLGLLLGLDIQGTAAHEMEMILGAVCGYDKAAGLIRILWRKMYGEKLSILLPDTYGTPWYLAGMTKEEARFFKGFRQDSGTPEQFVDWVIAFYLGCGLNRQEISEKIIIFSDGLNPTRAAVLQQYAKSKGIRALFGIGTNLSNDVGHAHFNIVIKPYEAAVISANGTLSEVRGCVKLSDNPAGKTTGEAAAKVVVTRWKESGYQLVEWEPLLPYPHHFFEDEAVS